MSTAQTYRVDLAIFRGPLDLLLYLVKRHEVEISDIPIALITEQYLHYLQVLQQIDVEAAGEFLVVASTLMEIKSRMLLPAAPETEMQSEAVDPRSDLVKQLIAYKQYREAADRLDALAAHQAGYWPRQAHEKPESTRALSEQPIQQVELWDLVSSFERLLRTTLTLNDRAIIDDDTPQQTHMDNIAAQLKATPPDAQGRHSLPFESLFTAPFTRGRLVGLFLALLEMIKLGQLQADQFVPFGTIMITLLPAQASSSREQNQAITELPSAII